MKHRIATRALSLIVGTPGNKIEQVGGDGLLRWRAQLQRGALSLALSARVSATELRHGA